MRKYIYLLFIPVIFLVLSIPGKTLADTFNYHIEPLAFSFLTPVGYPNHLLFSVFPPNVTGDTLYPFALNWKLSNGQFHFDLSNWITFKDKKISITDAKDYPVPFTLTAPADTNVGQFYKVVGVSNQQFSCDARNNPPIMLGIPVSVAVARPVNLITPGGTSGNGLYSYIDVLGFTSSYQIMTQSEQFNVTLKNQGNVSNTPSGFITIYNTDGEALTSLQINLQNLAILPKDTHQFTLMFHSNRFIAGEMKAELHLGYTSIIGSASSEIKQTIPFFYLSSIAAFVLVLLILLPFILSWLKIAPILPPLRYIAIITTLLITLSITYLIWSQTTLNHQILGAEALPPKTTTVTATATIADNLGLKVDPQNAHNITVMNRSTYGWELWSFRCTRPYKIATDDGTGTPKDTAVILRDSETQYPLLLVPTIFFH